MKEADIRPDELVAKNLELYKADVKRMMRRSGEFVGVPCPACGSRDATNTYRKDGFNYVTCTTCDTLYITPRPTLEMLMDFYKNAESIKQWSEELYPATEDIRKAEIITPRVWEVINLSSRYKTSRGALVDIGAGFGTFCMVMDQTDAFDNVIAVEPSHELASACARKGIPVIEESVEELDLTGANVITAFELIEHLFSPAYFLAACHKALVKDGLLILTTPNIKGFDLLVLGERSENIGGPNHLNYFHPTSLQSLLEDCGFEVLEWSTPGKLDAGIIAKKIQDGEFDGGPFLRFVLSDGWPGPEQFQEWLVQNRLSSHMMMVARKA